MEAPFVQPTTEDSEVLFGKSSYPFSELPEISPDKVKKQHEYEHNPFKYTDTDIFLFRSKAIKEKNEEQCRQQKRGIADKTTFASRAKAHAYSNRKYILEDDGEDDARKHAEDLLKCDATFALCNVQCRLTDKESLKQYIAKKRDLFLAQYSVAVKQEKLRTIEATLINEQRKITDSERKLEEETKAFEEFLNENDKKSADAMKMAEHETKMKLEKNLEIKKATAVMMAIKSDIQKKEEIYKELVLYEEFLRKLSPLEWQEEQNQKKELLLKAEQVQGEKPKKSREPTMPTIPQSRTLKTESTKEERIQSKFRRPEVRRATSRTPSITIAEKEEKEAPKHQKADSTDIEPPPEIYFTEPQQLLQVFTDLEEHNLTLIQNCQDTDEMLEEIRQRGYKIQDRMNRKTTTLQEHIDILGKTCEREEKRSKELQLRAKMFSDGRFTSEQDVILTAMNRKVSEVYRATVGEIQATSDTLKMLADIENKMEQIQDNLESIPKAKVEAASKTKQKERRLRLRDEKLKQQLIHQEEKLRRAFERATADPKIIMGRKLKPRSKPLRTKPKKSLIDLAAKLQEDFEYFFT